MFRLEAGAGRGVNYALTCAGRLGEGWQCSFPHRATGGDGCIGVSNSGRSGAGSPPLTSFLPWSPEIPAACLSLSSFSLSSELSFCPSGSSRSRSVSFFVPLSLSSLGSFLFKGPRWGVRTFRRSQSHFFTLHPFDCSVEPGSPSARSPRRANRPGLPPLLSALRRREARAVAKSPAWLLLSCRGAVSRTVPASRGAAAVGEVQQGLPLSPKTYWHFFAPSCHLRAL